MENFSWLWQSWRVNGPEPGRDLVFALIALVCGMLLGDERQRREKPAGLRTLALVCLGSAVFTMISFVFSTTTGDSGRVAAQIVTGIGFLGAGVILHGRYMVSGVTTAAIIWVAAAIGMVVGAGYIFAGLGLSILVNRFLVVAVLFVTRWNPDLHDVHVVLEYEPRNGLTRVRLERVLIDSQISDAELDWSEPSPENGRLKLTTKLARTHLYELLSDLADVSGVRSIIRERIEPVRASTSS